MDTIGLDLHKRESQLCVLTEAGEMVERRIGTSRERFTAVLGDQAPARILVEASSESEWVARHGLAAKLNTRPRKRLGFRTPEECYAR